MATTNEELISWINEQPFWIRDAVITYYDNGSFADKDIKRFAKECLDEVNGITKTLDISLLNLLSKDDRSNFAITAINNVKGVNALADGKSLLFGENGVTVIYGENGAGKSGYIRILKKLADAKYKDELKRNVYSSKKDKQSCEVEVVAGDSTLRLACDLSKDGEHSLLKDMDVFDTRISKAYVEAAKEASYEPWLFSMFSALAGATTKVKTELEEIKKGLDSSDISFPDELQNTDIAKKLLEIDLNTQFEDAFFVWTDDDEKLLAQKEKESNVEALIASVNQLKRENQQIESVRKYLELFIGFFSTDNVNIINEKKKKIISAKEELAAAKLLFEKEATDVDRKAVSNSAWLGLWKSAKAYYETVLSQEGYIKYTEKNGICPLCSRKITDEQHLHRVKSIEEYVNGNASDKLAESLKSYRNELKKCPKSWNMNQVEAVLMSCGFEQEMFEKIKSVASLVDKISTDIWEHDIDQVDIEEMDMNVVLKDIERIYKKKEELVKEKQELLQDDDHKNTIALINELRAKKKVSTLKKVVMYRIQYLQDANNIDKAIKLTSSNKLTTKSKQLAEELLTEDYVRRFNDELKKLTKGTVKATLKQQKASKGKIPFKVVLEGLEDISADPIDVLSEGENRVVSLAAFFAESSGRQVECPLIVDDPISSLDYKFEATVINRLVEAGKHRQVIVFTHRLSMVVGLHDLCGKTVPFTERELLGRGKNKGVPSDFDVYGSQALGRLKNLKNEKISKLKNMDENSDEYLQGIHYVCQQIRNNVEKSIEDYLLNGIVVRYRNSIQTLNKVKWLAEISYEDCKIVDDMMTKYSHYDHSMSEDTPLLEFSVEEIEADVDAFIQWISNVKSRIDKVNKK